MFAQNTKEPKEITKSRMLLSSPETVYQELKKYSESQQGKIFRTCDEIEQALFCRNEKLINLGLAQYAGCKEIVIKLYADSNMPEVNPQDAEFARAIKVACLSNQNILSTIDKESIFDVRELIEETQEILAAVEKPKRPDTISMAKSKEYRESRKLYSSNATNAFSAISALLTNPKIPTDILKTLYERTGDFAEIDTDLWLDLVSISSDNQRLSTDIWGGDGYDFGLADIQYAIIKMLETAPLTLEAAGVIYSVLKSLDPYHSRSFGNAAIVLERWKAVQSNRENERIEKGYYSDRPYIEEFCCFIASLYGCGQDKRKRELGKPSDKDIVKRCAYYGRSVSSMKPKQIEEAYEKDGNIFVLAALNNDYILLSTEKRKRLENFLQKEFYGKYFFRCNQISKRHDDFNPEPLNRSIGSYYRKSHETSEELRKLESFEQQYEAIKAEFLDFKNSIILIIVIYALYYLFNHFVASS
ncbi:MAG: hypothetical protein IPO55_11685 [Alphaproteobacteria bacterium]|nr:hypothetical protein [Alphaproteobacteria bacterium]